MPSVSSIASSEPNIITLNDDSNEPTTPYGFGRQLPIIPLSLNDLNLPPNPFNILATMAVVNQEHDANYSLWTSEPSEPSPISTPPMNVSTFDLLTAGRRLKRRRTTIRSTSMLNLGEYLFCHQLLPHRCHPESWKEN